MGPAYHGGQQVDLDLAGGQATAQGQESGLTVGLVVVIGGLIVDQVKLAISYSNSFFKHFDKISRVWLDLSNGRR